MENDLKEKAEQTEPDSSPVAGALGSHYGKKLYRNFPAFRRRRSGCCGYFASSPAKS